jgi:bla regulator protein BlaR1
MPATLVRASLDGAIVVAAIWLTTCCLRRLSPSTRAALWWCATAKFVVVLFWVTPIAVPILPAEGIFRLKAEDGIFRLKAEATGAESKTAQHASANVAPAQTPNSVAQTPDSVASAFRRKSPLPQLTMQAALLGAWGAGVLVAMLAGFRGWRRTARVVRRSAAGTPVMQGMAAQLGRRLRLRRLPEVRVSTEIDTPLVTGLLRPVVLLPAGTFDALSASQQQMVLCHELAHIARGDLWLGCIPALAERLFFFHPLVRLASREYGFWREAACDAAVLEALDAAPQDYGRLLLDLGVAQPRTSLSAAGAPWSFRNLKRRIVMLSDRLSDRSTRTFGSRLTAAAVLGISAVLMAPFQPVARASAVVPVVQEPAVSAAPVAASTAVPPAEEADGQRSVGGQQQPELNYVMFFGDDRTMMSGSGTDMQRARRLKQGSDHLLWFRWSGREYVVRDRDAMGQVEQLWRRVGELGKQQGHIGGEQGKLGAQQGAIGARQGEIGAEQGRLGARQGELGARQGRIAMRELDRMTADQRAEIEKDRRQIEIEMRELDREMRALDAKMRELDKPMRELGVEMEVLGREMEKLGRQMEEESRKAEMDMRALLQRLISSGVAESVK